MVLEYINLFFSEAVSLFIEMAPYILLGVGIAGFLHIILKKDFVARQIGGNNIGSVFKAALFGVPLPLCSCGVVPTAVYLKNSGASKAAVTSFLISTPQTGIDSISATWGMLGPLFAVFKALAALIIGTAGGIADFILDRRNEETKELQEQKREQNTVKTAEIERYPGLWGKVKEMFRYAFFELLDDIAVNFIIGLAIAAVISIAIPDDFFNSTFLSNPFVSMVLMVIIGIPMYICSTSSIPIAVALIANGVAPGAAYVFLVAGPATNAASLAIIGKALGRKTTIRYLTTIIAGSMIFGFAMDRIYTAIGISPFGAAMQHHHAENNPGIFLTAVSIFFLIMMIILLTRKIRSRFRGKTGTCSCGSDSHCSTNSGNGTSGIGTSEKEENTMTKINIDGMSCSHCTASVEKALSSVSGIRKIKVSLEGKFAEIDGNFDIAEAETAISNAGYTVAGTKSS